MDSLHVECLRCGTSRVVQLDAFHNLESPECPSCGYLGWAPLDALSEQEQTELREKPLEKRRADLA